MAKRIKQKKRMKPGPMPTDDLTGRTFGQWEVVAFAGRCKHKRPYWRVVCSCGNWTNVWHHQLTSGRSTRCRSCGKAKVGPKYPTKRKRLYNVWRNMLGRCYDPDALYFKEYGGRGITVCDEWREDFETFHTWALASGYQRGLKIERKDNDAGYSPENCEWITNRQQNVNRRETIKVYWQGEWRALCQLAFENGIPARVARVRFHAGWPIKRILTEPVKVNPPASKR